MTKAEEFKTSHETQHLGVKEDLNAFESPGFQSNGLVMVHMLPVCMCVLGMESYLM